MKVLGYSSGRGEAGEFGRRRLGLWLGGSVRFFSRKRGLPVSLPETILSFDRVVCNRVIYSSSPVRAKVTV